MTITRMDHVGVVVDDLAAAVAFFDVLGLEVENAEPQPVEGLWMDRVVGLDGAHVDIVFVRTPDGHSRLELTQFRTPASVSPTSTAPHTLGLRSLMFAVDDIDQVVARLQAHGARLVGDVVQYEDVYRLCYVHGPAGIIVALAEELR